MYHFVKFNDTWYLKPESVQDIIDHFNKICGREIKQGFNDFADNVQFIKDKDGNVIDTTSRNHTTSIWRYAVETSMKAKGNSWLNSANELENRTFQDRLKLFQAGRPIYFTDGLPYYVGNEHPKYDEEKWSEELKYPYKFDFDQVRYIQWPNGRHWYAKIGNIDIVDKWGNQKWNDKYHAMRIAKYFCMCGGDWKNYKNEII